ncbi:MAG: HD domain-containing protein [Firmicutes bacterium]|nr:HD domain-containing protein [Bacillota bacterium]
MPKENIKPVTLEQVKANPEFRALIEAANKNLEVMGYTEHGLRHVGFASKTTSNILRELGFDARTVELGAIAGFIHDIGNSVNRKNHGQTGAVLAYAILRRMKMRAEEIATVIGAIGNHEEETGIPVNPVSAALIIADKSDAHRSRVRKKNLSIADVHSRVNISIKRNYITVDHEKKVIRLFIYMDTAMSAPMEYLQIYLSRMVLCEQAAGFLQCSFELIINKVVINRRGPIPTGNLLEKGEKNVSEGE